MTDEERTHVVESITRLSGKPPSLHWVEGSWQATTGSGMERGDCYSNDHDDPDLALTSLLTFIVQVRST